MPPKSVLHPPVLQERGGRAGKRGKDMVGMGEEGREGKGRKRIGGEGREESDTQKT